MGEAMTGSSNWIRKERRLALYIRSGFHCAYCGRDLKDAASREMGLDHLEDLIPGGGHKGANNNNDNLVLACTRCNSARGSKPWREYATGGAIDRIEVLRYQPVNVALAKALLASGTRWGDR